MHGQEKCVYVELTIGALIILIIRLGLGIRYTIIIVRNLCVYIYMFIVPNCLHRL